MMSNLRFALIVCCVFFLAMSEVFAQQKLPSFDGFEDADSHSRWTFVQPTSPHKWHIGKATSLMDSTSLYVSADGGKSLGYTNSAKGIAAYTTYTLPAGMYNVSFDFRVVGEVDSKGVGLDSLYVYWVTSPSERIIETNGDRPKSLEIYRQLITTDDVLFGPELWHHSSFTARVRGNNTPVRLVFYWVNNSKNIVDPGVAIDNVQVYADNDACTMPADFTVSHENGAKLSWTSTSASHYQIICMNTTTGTQTVLDSVYDSPYNVLGLDKGIYSFFVRGICGSDTSAWNVHNNHVLAVSSDKCINFIDIHNPNVAECRYGKFGESADANLGVMDFGFESELSQHTVHYQQGERDPKVPELRTIAPGDLASVRLGNWRGKSEAECISYTFTVDKDNPILVVKYACVMVNIGHNGDDLKQPRFIMRVTDSRGVPLDPQCLSVEYLTGSKLMPPGWNRIPIGQGQVGDGEQREFYIEWKNWTSMGMNLSAYVGRTVKVYLETGDCGPAPSESCPAWAYFTMDCVSDKLSGLTCGAAAEKPDTVWAPKGFRYEWVKKQDPAKVLFTDQFFVPQAGDTATYLCRINFVDPGREACAFELEAALSPRYPAANASYIPCRQTVNFIDSSYVFTINGKSSEVPDVFWDFGDGVGTSTEHNPIYTYEKPGKYEVTLRASIDDGMCDSIWTDSIVVTADTLKVTDTVYICSGDMYLFGERYLREPGIYVDSLYNIYGCDSISVLDLRLHDTYADSVICGGDVFVFEGEEMVLEAGVHELTYKNIKSVHGCDSILRLKVSDEIMVEYATPLCADDDAVRFSISGGMADSVTVLIDAEPFTPYSCAIVDNQFELPFDEGVMAGKYKVDFKFYNEYCGVTERSIDLIIQYPSSIIAQRWNDVLAIRNEEHNGGYDFSGFAFQWYAGDMPIDGANSSTYYTPDDNLNTSVSYTVLITDQNGVAIMSCPFEAQSVTTQDSDFQVDFTNKAPGENVNVEVKSSEAQLRIYDSVGRQCAVYTLPQGVSSIVMPTRQGVYILHIVNPDGRSERHKILIQD